MPFRIVECTFPDNLSRNSCIFFEAISKAVFVRRVRKIIVWKPRTKLGTRQLATPLVYDPDTELSILRSVRDEGFWKWPSFLCWGKKKNTKQLNTLFILRTLKASFFHYVLLSFTVTQNNTKVHGIGACTEIYFIITKENCFP